MSGCFVASFVASPVDALPPMFLVIAERMLLPLQPGRLPWFRLS